MQYKYFIFDEFQDVSQLQYDILLEFKKLGCILTVVGKFLYCLNCFILKMFLLFEWKKKVMMLRISTDSAKLKLTLSSIVSTKIWLARKKMLLNFVSAKIIVVLPQ